MYIHIYINVSMANCCVCLLACLLACCSCSLRVAFPAKCIVLFCSTAYLFQEIIHLAKKQSVEMYKQSAVKQMIY